jgi:hypothetical protein
MKKNGTDKKLNLTVNLPRVKGTVVWDFEGLVVISL